jgi:hypothetical protein
MSSRRVAWRLLVWLLLAHPLMVRAQYNCVAAANPPKLPVTRPSGRNFSAAPLRVQLTAGIADTWKEARREIGSVPAGTMVEVLEDMIVIDAPDIVRVTEPIEGLHLKDGDTILRYARLGEGSADFWVPGCWYKEANADFITEPDGAGCGGSNCAARVTKMGRQLWWFRIRLPNGKVGWTLSQALDLSAGG